MTSPDGKTTEPVIRNLRQEDIKELIRIDSHATGYPRDSYFERKFSRIFGEESQLLLSLVAEVDNNIAGYIMGEANTGEYGIPESVASVDTIGVDPVCQHLGVGAILLSEYCTLAAKAGIEKMTTLVSGEDEDLLEFFERHNFKTAKIIALEKNLVSELSVA